MDLFCPEVVIGSEMFEEHFVPLSGLSFPLSSPFGMQTLNGFPLCFWFSTFPDPLLLVTGTEYIGFGNNSWVMMALLYFLFTSVSLIFTCFMVLAPSSAFLFVSLIFTSFMVLPPFSDFLSVSLIFTSFIVLPPFLIVSFN